MQKNAWSASFTTRTLGRYLPKYSNQPYGSVKNVELMFPFDFHCMRGHLFADALAGGGDAPFSSVFLFRDIDFARQFSDLELELVLRRPVSSVRFS